MVSACSVCATPQEAGSPFCGRCGNAFPQVASPAVASALTATPPDTLTLAGPSAVDPSAAQVPPAALSVTLPDGTAGILTFTDEHVLVQGDSVMQRWARSSVRDVRHDPSSVAFVAAGQLIALGVTAGDPESILGPSSGDVHASTTPGKASTDLPHEALAWSLVAAMAAGTIGMLLMLADDLPFSLAGGLWMVGVLTPGIAVLRAVLSAAPAGELEAFDTVRPVLVPAAQFAPAIGGFGALLLVTEEFPGTPFLVWMPMAVTAGLAAWLLWRLVPNRTDEEEASG